MSPEQQDALDRISRQLDDLIGMDSAKRAYNQILLRMQYRALLEAEGKPKPDWTNHMAFIGNPGTGKTTFAHIIAETMHAAGELPSDSVKTVSASSLMGDYVGLAQKLVSDAFEEARGGVLFIDEAHAFADNPYGKDALRALVPLMENHRDDTAVFFGGYPGMREKLNKLDKGFDSRVPTTVPFDDYDSKEQLEIFDVFARKKGVVIDPDARKNLKKLLPEYVGANNARGVRNAYQAVMDEHVASVLGPEKGRKIQHITGSDVQAALEPRLMEA